MLTREARRRRLLSVPLVIGLAVGLAAGTSTGAAGSAAGFPDHVRRPAYFSLDGPPPAPNWVVNPCSNPVATFSHGILTIDTPAFDCFEYVLHTPLGVWNRWVSNERGWRVKAKVEVDPASEGSCQDDRDSARLWMHDHTSLVIVGIAPDWVCLVYPDEVVVPYTTTDRFHTYRIESKGRIVRVYVDGELVIDHTLTWRGGGTEALIFGDGTVGGGSEPDPVGLLLLRRHAGLRPRRLGGQRLAGEHTGGPERRNHPTVDRRRRVRFGVRDLGVLLCDEVVTTGPSPPPPLAWRTGGARPAPHAGEQRDLHGLGSHHAWTASTTTSTSASSPTEGRGARGHDASGLDGLLRSALAQRAGPRPCPFR